MGATDESPDQAGRESADQAGHESADQASRESPGQAADELPAGVAAIGRRHGVPADQVTEVAGGVANRGFTLGETLFLRIARPGFEDDLRKEASVVPFARSAGVLTPAIVEYDDTRQLIDAPYAVMERVHGTEPTDVPPGLAEQLARLHLAEPTDLPDVPKDDRDDPWPLVDDLAERGYLDPGTANWLSDWFNRLADRFDRFEPKVLIHGDVAAHNLLATPSGRLSALIDWGDAAGAPRAMDFAKLPLDHVATILPTYVQHHHALAPGQPAVREDELAAATLWFHLHWGLGKLTAPPWPGQRHWTAPPASRVLGLLKFFTAAPPAPWATLT